MIKSATKAKALKRKNVQVVVRTRPLSNFERSQKCRDAIVCDSVMKILCLKNTCPKTTNERHSDRVFGPFDKVYGPEVEQIQIYMDAIYPLINEVLAGYNCTVFAYGQTGSGKTYTMEGIHDDAENYSWENDPKAGIIPRALHQIFSMLNQSEGDWTVRVSYVELYNEYIYDLLSRSEASQTESLRIVDDKNKGGVIVIGAEEIVVRNRDDIYALLKRGAEKRRTASTLMNATSSRSHSVFTINIMVREVGLVNGEELLRQGKFNFVDLAGSENVGRSGATDVRAREAGNINTSLLTLGRVITALTTNFGHIPYRESKLTRILQDSLGGKTITTIIATLSPASSNFDESVNTLEYAQRAKNIKNCPEVNKMVTRKGLLKEYNDEIERLRRDLVSAREMHGVYLDKENYDSMIAQKEDQKIRIEELEGQLELQLHKLSVFISNLELMDQQYEKIFNKYQMAIEKLTRRKQEVENLKQEKANIERCFNAAKAALSVSVNKSVCLRSHASNIQEVSKNYFNNLQFLHDKLTTVRDIFAQNHGKLDGFTSGFISQMAQVKQQLETFDMNTSQQMAEAKKVSDMLGKNISQTIGKVFSSNESAIQRMSAYISSIYQNLRDFDDRKTNLFSKISANHEQINIIAKQKTEEIALVRSDFIDQLILLKKARDESNSKHTAAFQQAKDDISALLRLISGIQEKLHQDQCDFNATLKQSIDYIEEKATTLEASICSEIKIKSMEFDELREDVLQNDKKMSENVRGFEKFISEAKDFLAESNDEMNAFNVTGMNTVQSLESITKGQEYSSEAVVENVSKKLDLTISEFEYLKDHELKGIISTGMTPQRPTESAHKINLDLIPTADEQFDEQQRILTPMRRSFFVERDSILDSTAFFEDAFSPDQVKQKLNLNERKFIRFDDNETGE